MKRSFIIVVILSLAALSVSAQQRGRQKPDREKWFQELREWKHQFLIKEVELTEEQQPKFFAMYDAMQNEILAIHDGSRNMEKKLSLNKQASDLEYEKMAEALIEVKIKEGEIQKRYLDKMKTVISSRQLYKLQVAEKKFIRMLNRQHNKHLGDKGKAK
ncbi:MAG: hypothetical protein IJS19_05970 [Muribaculaceae bacterium]|nr:hypothetical protein [Muribaculaceae bacterium]